MTAKKTTPQSRANYWHLYWWSLSATFLGVVLGAFLMWRWVVGASVAETVEPSSLIISAGSGIASHYPNSDEAYQITLKNVTPRMLWLGNKQQSISLDKFLSKVWYLDNGEKMRQEPVKARLIMTKPTDGKLLVIPLRITDPRYDLRAKTLLFRADAVETMAGENKLADIPSSFLANDVVFDANRFLDYEFLSSLK